MSGAATSARSEGKADAPETIGAITGVMEELAGHRANIERHAQPELDFTGAADE